MASITANQRPTSRYRAPVPRRHLPPIPPQWFQPWSFRAPPPLSQFVLLSMLLHALLIALFGAPSGGSREGRAMWGSTQFELRGLLIEPAPAPIGAPREESAAPQRAADNGPVPASAPAPEPPAPASAPKAARVAVPDPFPRVLDRLIRSEPRLDEPPPLKVPQPTEVPAAPTRQAPVVAPEARVAPAEIPPPLPVTPALRPERMLAEPPPISAPLVQPVPAAKRAAPAPVERTAPPAIERAPVETRALPATPVTRPAEGPPVEVRAIPVPALESLAPTNAEPAARPMEMAPIPEIQRAPAAPAPTPRVETRPAPRAEPATSAPATQAPATAPRSLPAAPQERAFPREPRREGAGPASDYDPTAPSLDLDAIRSRAGEIAREGSGQRAILPFPMPPVPEKKSKVQTAIENARKPDCRTAYQGLGIAAIVPLIANEFGEGSCRW